MPVEMQWHLRRLARRLGGWGLLALAACGLALGGYVVMVRPLQQEIAALRQQAKQMPRIPVVQAPEVSPQERADAELEDFRARFPGIEGLSDQLDLLFELTSQHGLAVDRADYALVEKAGGAMRRFEVTLPLRGSYVQVRAFVNSVLEQLPSVAIADIQLERGKIAEGRVNGNLRLVFFVRKAG